MCLSKRIITTPIGTVQIKLITSDDSKSARKMLFQFARISIEGSYQVCTDTKDWGSTRYETTAMTVELCAF